MTELVECFKALSEKSICDKQEMIDSKKQRYMPFYFDIYSKFVENDLKLNDFLVFSYLLNFVNENMELFYPSQSRIANALKMHRVTVNKCIDKLEKLEIIDKGFRNGTTCFYSINLEKIRSNDFFKIKSQPVAAGYTPPVAADYTNILYSLNNLNIQHQQISKNVTNVEDLNKKEIGLPEVELKTTVVNEDGKYPLPPFTNDAVALDAQALDAESNEFKIIVNKNPKPTQMVLKSAEVVDGVIHLQLLTNPAAFDSKNNDVFSPLSKKELLRGANARLGENVFSKSDQLRKSKTVEPEDKKKEFYEKQKAKAKARAKDYADKAKGKAKGKASEKVKLKRGQFEIVFDAFKLACDKHGYAAPEKQASNDSINKMISSYGIDRCCQMVSVAVANWHNLNDIVKNFNHRPVPTLSEIAIGFFSEHLFARVVAEEKGLVKKKSQNQENGDRRELSESMLAILKASRSEGDKVG